MPKHFLIVFDLKYPAFILAFASLVGGLVELILSIKYLIHANESGERTLLITVLVMGLVSLVSGSILTVGIVKGNHDLLFLYFVLGLANLIIVTVYSGINMFEDYSLLFMLIPCLFLWYCHYCYFYFFEEIRAYNMKSAGVIEVVYQERGLVKQKSIMRHDASFDSSEM